MAVHCLGRAGSYIEALNDLLPQGQPSPTHGAHAIDRTLGHVELCERRLHSFVRPAGQQVRVESVYEAGGNRTSLLDSKAGAHDAPEAVMQSLFNCLSIPASSPTRP